MKIKLLTEPRQGTRQQDYVRQLFMGILNNAILPMIILVLCTLLSMYFKQSFIHEANIVLTYVVGVIVVAYISEGYISSVLTSVVAILLFNFFFTEPYFSLKVYSKEYVVIFIFMFVSAVLTSSLTVKARRESHLAEVRANRSQVQYQLSQRLLRVEGIEDVYRISGEVLSGAILGTVHLFYYEVGNMLGHAYKAGKFKANETLASHHQSEIVQIIKTPKTSIVPSRFYDDESIFYVPIVGQRSCHGVIGISYLQDALQNERNELASAVASQMALAIDRELIRVEKRESDMILESEQFRANLLRAISHDLRTPLTAIHGTLSTLRDNYEYIEKEAQWALLKNAQEDSAWLIHTVENILSLTRIDDTGFDLNLREEYIEELLEDVLRRMDRRCQYHKIQVLLPDEPIAVHVEARLIEQVFINLLDNAIKYTPEGSKIIIRVERLDTTVKITFEDNGPGIPIASLDRLFTRFYTLSQTSDRGRKGIGLGLEICSAIVKAHHGEIHVYNSRHGGAVFEITLKLGGKQ